MQTAGDDWQGSGQKYYAHGWPCRPSVDALEHRSHCPAQHSFVLSHRTSLCSVSLVTALVVSTISKYACNLVTRFLNGVTLVGSGCCEVSSKLWVSWPPAVSTGGSLSTPLMDCSYSGKDLAIEFIKTNIFVCWIVAHEGSGHD